MLIWINNPSGYHKVIMGIFYPILTVIVSLIGLLLGGKRVSIKLEVGE